tara:strand:+ start:37 stop:405 length:369 start_codon:yes stop_codon:yes gene_type:complete
MGKKRRLKSAKAKFSAKHSSHPRARLLATKSLNNIESTEKIENEKVTPPEATETIISQLPAPDANEGIAAAAPIESNTVPVIKSTKVNPTRKKTTTPRKKTTTKPRKTTKRATKKKSTAPAT